MFQPRGECVCVVCVCGGEICSIPQSYAPNASSHASLVFRAGAQGAALARQGRPEQLAAGQR